MANKATHAPKQETSTEVAVPQQVTALALQNHQAIADMQKEFGPLMNVRKELIRVATIKLCQDLTPEVKSRTAVAGDFISSLHGINYGETVDVIPIMISESASYQDENNKLICSSDDLIHNKDGVLCSQCPHGVYWNQWKVEGDKRIAPECKASIDVLCFAKNGENKDPIIVEINFRKKNYAAGRALINFAKNDVRGVPFGSVYTLQSTSETNNKKQEFRVIQPIMERRKLDEEHFSMLIPKVVDILKEHKQGNLQREVNKDDELPI